MKWDWEVFAKWASVAVFVVGVVYAAVQLVNIKIQKRMGSIRSQFMCLMFIHFFGYSLLLTLTIVHPLCVRYSVFWFSMSLSALCMYMAFIPPSLYWLEIAKNPVQERSKRWKKIRLGTFVTLFVVWIGLDAMHAFWSAYNTVWEEIVRIGSHCFVTGGIVVYGGVVFLRRMRQQQTLFQTRPAHRKETVARFGSIAIGGAVFLIAKAIADFFGNFYGLENDNNLDYIYYVFEGFWLGAAPLATAMLFRPMSGGLRGRPSEDNLFAAARIAVNY